MKEAAHGTDGAIKVGLAMIPEKRLKISVDDAPLSNGRENHTHTKGFPATNNRRAGIKAVTVNVNAPLFLRGNGRIPRNFAMLYEKKKISLRLRAVHPST